MQYRNCLEDSFTVSTATRMHISLPVEIFISQLLICLLAISRKSGLMIHAAIRGMKLGRHVV